MRFSGRREAVIGLGVYAVCLAVRRAVYNDRGRTRAVRNAERIVALERRLRIHVGPVVQQRCIRRSELIMALNVGYITLNIGLTLGTLLRLYFTRDPKYHELRRAAALAMTGAQPFFLLLPTAPPRTLDSFTDTMRDAAGIDLDNGILSKLHNPISAMPSIHLAFAVVTSAAVSQTADNVLVRRLALVYPPAVFLTVVATANHYVLDGVAGALLGMASLRLARR